MDLTTTPDKRRTDRFVGTEVGFDMSTLQAAEALLVYY